MKHIFYYIFGLLILSVILLGTSSSLNITTVMHAKVLDLQQQQIIHGSKNSVSTDIRYLVITDKGTFISETDFLNGKFNNSDVFFNLHKDSIYNLKVCGYGKGLFFDYKNILKVSKP